MNTDSTDDYVAAVVRQIPQRKRAEVERELRALIADEIDGRIASGEPAVGAERSALRDLGDPGALADRYHPGARVLLSGRVYRAWSRASFWSCAVVLPIVYVVLVVVRAVHGDNLGAVIFLPLGVTITVAMYLLVGMTALFAAIDRHDARLGSGIDSVRRDDPPGGD